MNEDDQRAKEAFAHLMKVMDEAGVALISADALKEIYQQAVESEREECAKVADRAAKYWMKEGSQYLSVACTTIAIDIRARGQG